MLSYPTLDVYNIYVCGRYYTYSVCVRYYTYSVVQVTEYKLTGSEHSPRNGVKIYSADTLDSRAKEPADATISMRAPRNAGAPPSPTLT